MLTESGFFKEGAPGRASSSSVPSDLVPGRRVAEKYELVRKIGIGAMGEVWSARHLSLDEQVAIKLVLRDVKHEDGSTADSRFLLEARVARMLSVKTRHIVSVTDHGDEGEVAYLVMELLNGEALDTRLGRSGPLDLDKVVPIVQQLARALSVAHGEGIVHRDLKPGNVFLTLDEEGKPLIKILDFGIAKLRDDKATVAEGEGRTSLPKGLTARDAKHATLRGFLLGTPAFMSPEQARGKTLDQRADVWALGVITYHLLTAQFPFDGATAEDLFSRLTKVQPSAITAHRQDLPPAITALFDRAFAKKIDDRFGSADAFADALDIAAGNRVEAQFSMPPPAPTRALESGAAPMPLAGKPQGTSIIAAGVPRNNRQIAIAAVLLVAVVAAFAIGFQRFGRDGSPSGLAAGASKLETTGAATRLDRTDDAIPAPEPAEEKAQAQAQIAPEPATLPSAEPAEPAEPAPPQAAPPPVVMETAPVPVAPPPVAPAPRGPVDKSQVF